MPPTTFISSLRPDSEEDDLFTELLKKREESKASSIRMELITGLQRQLREDALRANEDPIVMVERQVEGIGPGKMLLRNFLAGMHQAGTGQPIKNLRETLYEREILKKTLETKARETSLERITQLLGQAQTQETSQFTQENQNLREAVGRVPKPLTPQEQRQKDQEEQDRLLGLQESSLDIQKKREDLLKEDEPKVASSPKAQATQELVLSDTWKGLSSEEKIDQLAKLDRRFDKPQKTGGKGSEKGRLQVYTGPDGTVYNAMVGADGSLQGPPVALPFREMSAADRTRLDSINQQINVLSNLRAELDTIPEGVKITEPKFVFGTNFFDKAGHVLPEGVQEFAKTLTGLSLNLSPEQQKISRLHQELILTATKAFTGAQATDAERQFIETTLPRLFYKQGNYREAVESIQAMMEARAVMTQYGLSAPDMDFMRLQKKRKDSTERLSQFDVIMNSLHDPTAWNFKTDAEGNLLSLRRR